MSDEPDPLAERTSRELLAVRDADDFLKAEARPETEAERDPPGCIGDVEELFHLAHRQPYFPVVAFGVRLSVH